MDSAKFIALVPWIIAHGYFLFFILALLEGSLVTTAAGIACALGYFNIFIIILLAVMGDVVADVVYYGIGYHSRRILTSPFFKRFGLTEARVQKIEHLLHTHTYKTLLLIKLSPFLGPPGLIIIGASHISFKKFFKSALVITLPKCLFFALIGFFFGQAYIELAQKFNNHLYIFLGLALVVAGIYFLYRRITSRATAQI